MEAIAVEAAVVVSRPEEEGEATDLRKTLISRSMIGQKVCCVTSPLPLVILRYNADSFQVGGSGNNSPHPRGRGRGSGYNSPRGGFTPSRGGGFTPRGGYGTPRGGNGTPRGGYDSPRGRGRGNKPVYKSFDQVDPFGGMGRGSPPAKNRAPLRGKVGNWKSRMGAGVPLSKLLSEDRPLLRPIVFVRSVHTATLFEEEEEILKPLAEDVGKSNLAHFWCLCTHL